MQKLYKLERLRAISTIFCKRLITLEATHHHGVWPFLLGQFLFFVYAYVIIKIHISLCGEAEIMQDFRNSLSIGTLIKLESGSIFEISGKPIGFGGGSIIYPANRLILKDGLLAADGLSYALKECYPVSVEHAYTRNSNGEISPRDSSEQSNFYLHRAQKFLLQEGKVSGDIYKTASRMLPIRESSEKVTLTLPRKGVPCLVANTVTVMDSLSGKGQSIRECLWERNRFTPAETFRIIQQLLFALREVHKAGYLHLDIQDGNIFLRGALEDKSELVTLIDFGSARTMVDGKTAPIEDRVIFTSRGFSAPEMLLRNDGTLQLTPEADIYSIGCLTLYLLTGRKTESSVLLANKTGKYLRPNDIRRMHSPRHLIDRIQEILAKALEKEPTDRYHSVDEMLKDVNDLVAALQPYRTDLNTVKYDAFVCYKHGAIDSKAAMTLQRKLEQFRAPKGVAHSRRPFKRVFVDEGELSSCADFGEQIREALKNAGWLVVICSPNTPTSPWVQLEIDTFLECHDRSRILAVLTDGEPRNAFPPSF